MRPKQESQPQLGNHGEQCHIKVVFRAGWDKEGEPLIETPQQSLVSSIRQQTEPVYKIPNQHCSQESRPQNTGGFERLGCSRSNESEEMG